MCKRILLEIKLNGKVIAQIDENGKYHLEGEEADVVKCFGYLEAKYCPNRKVDTETNQSIILAISAYELDQMMQEKRA